MLSRRIGAEIISLGNEIMAYRVVYGRRAPENINEVGNESQDAYLSTMKPAIKASIASAHGLSGVPIDYLHYSSGHCTMIFPQGSYFEVHRRAESSYSQMR